MSAPPVLAASSLSGTDQCPLSHLNRWVQLLFPKRLAAARWQKAVAVKIERRLLASAVNGRLPP
jgi:hypothetical protein